MNEEERSSTKMVMCRNNTKIEDRCWNKYPSIIEEDCTDYCSECEEVQE